MTIQNVDLSALISTRICHDLINPIGAINNGLELLDAVGTAPGPELSLVSDSASSATAKLNVFRLAFGDVKTSSEVKGEQVALMIRNMYEGGRVSVDWQTAELGYKRHEIKLALLLLFCLESALPFGGETTVSYASGIWTFKATGRKIAINQDLWGMTTGGAMLEDTSASDVHFLVARLCSDQNAKKITLHNTEEEIIVMVS